MNRIYIGLLASLLVSTATVASTPDDILGYWRTIDDETGFAKAIVHIQRADNNTYVGIVAEIIERPDYKPVQVCTICPEPFKGRRIVGMPLIWNMKAETHKGFQYTGGYAIDPISGKIYAGDIRLSPDSRRITLRGKVIGAGFLNRSQTWLRENNYKPK
ncbi:MAG: DUF2147 domain-containing protein [Pseudomonadota bacterium]|nr:DUF2147 domain-containing protein [Pseudomonadota bacterium]